MSFEHTYINKIESLKRFCGEHDPDVVMEMMDVLTRLLRDVDINDRISVMVHLHEVANPTRSERINIATNLVIQSLSHDGKLNKKDLKLVLEGIMTGCDHLANNGGN